jgi:hypothetical protein
MTAPVAFTVRQSLCRACRTRIATIFCYLPRIVANPTKLQPAGITHPFFSQALRAVHITKARPTRRRQPHRNAPCPVPTPHCGAPPRVRCRKRTKESRCRYRLSSPHCVAQAASVASGAAPRSEAGHASSAYPSSLMPNDMPQVGPLKRGRLTLGAPTLRLTL